MEKPPTIALGDFRVAFLTDGFWWNDGGCMLGVAPRELWQREHPPDERNRIRLNLTCPLVIRGGEALLIDTGIGNRLGSVERRIFDHGDGWLLEGLRALGMEPGDVTGVVLSHLHFDHCGGIVRRRPSGVLEASFPRARVFIQRGELETARDNKNERLRAAYRHVAECIEPVAATVEALDGDIEIIPGLTAVVTGGHTRDHQIARLRTEQGCFVHLADIVPTRSHMRGPWNQAYDLDPIRTMEEKARYLHASVDEGSWVSFAHDDRVFAAQIANDKGRLVTTESIAATETVA